MIELVQAELNKTEEKISSLKTEILDVLKNKELSLNSRWDFFKKIPMQYLNIGPWVEHFKWEEKYQEISWYDDFYRDRYSVVEMKDIIESMEEDAEDWHGQEAIDEFKEEILQAGLFSFENDW